MNKSQLGSIFGGLVLLVAVVVIIIEVRPEHTTEGQRGSVFYSDDDGQTYFTDSMFKFPPFDHNGKTAVRANVYSCSTGKFVGSLQRYTPTAHAILEDEYSKNPTKTDPVEITMNSHDMAYGGTEMKLPGPTNKWMPMGEFKESMVKSPDGGPAAEVVP